MLDLSTKELWLAYGACKEYARQANKCAWPEEDMQRLNALLAKLRTAAVDSAWNEAVKTANLAA